MQTCSDIERQTLSPLGAPVTCLNLPGGEAVRQNHLLHLQDSIDSRVSKRKTLCISSYLALGLQRVRSA